MALDPLLLDILACPDDKGPLYYLEDEETLYNPRLRRRYAIRDGIPIMLIDEAETVDGPEDTRIMGRVAAEGIKPTFEAPAVDTPTIAAPPADGSPVEKPPVEGSPAEKNTQA